MQSEIILGIDPGSRVTGYGVISFSRSSLRYLASGVVRAGDKELSERLCLIYSNIRGQVQLYKPDYVSIESVFVNQNIKGALTLGHARGVALLAGVQDGATLAEYSPRSVKKTCVGYGNAQKDQVQYMVKQLLGITKSLKEDEADALAIAICHANHMQVTNRIL